MPFINEVFSAIRVLLTAISPLTRQSCTLNKSLISALPIYVLIDLSFQGIASRDDIDKTLKLGMNHPMGPLQLADLYVIVKSCLLLLIFPSIGLDTCLSIQQTLYEGRSDSKYRPSVLLERMVDAGWLGKKSGKGFYDYN